MMGEMMMQEIDHHVDHDDHVNHDTSDDTGDRVADHVKGFDEIEAELKAFEAAERKRLNLDDKSIRHWIDANPQTFTRVQRDSTTILCGGLTMAHDRIVAAALSGLGYQVKPLDMPDTESLRFGKEFGNRGQCNPTYFTVGNLVKYLVHLRDTEQQRVEDIIARYVFMTAGACGPCRFGTYVTEYRKALRDAGFDGFRVLLFQQQGGLRQATGDDAGLEFTPTFFLKVLKAIMAADVLNLLAYRVRPYEVGAGDTDRALEECKTILEDAFTRRQSTVVALLRCRRVMSRIRVDWLQPKPKVAIIGEFWAMTTEGDGNYRLQRFLEAEGAEVDVQPVTAWLLYNIWEHAWDTKRRMTLKHDDDDGRFGLQGKNPRRKLAILSMAEQALRVTFALYCRAIGLGGYRLSNMDEIATISHPYYDNHLRGGEGHMEVGKLIQHVEQRKSHMVISVKPFGCMPSSGVSDGVQSLVTARHPDAIFCPIETTGDGAVNVQSRVLMDLFKARERAQKEHEDLLRAAEWSPETAERRARCRRFDRAPTYPRHVVAGTAANAALELLPRRKRLRVLERFRLVERSRFERARSETGVKQQADRGRAPAFRPGIGWPNVAFRDGPIRLVPWPHR
jgi:predicted nucleotide-binding protein (sugar kinase/HSP70/actin superfamily)